MAYTHRAVVKQFHSDTGVLRHVLVDSKSGLMLELQSIFIYRNHPSKSNNTHKGMLKQLAHFYEWCLYEKKKHEVGGGDEKWVWPEERLMVRELPLKPYEIDGYAEWCDYKSKVLCQESNSQKRPISQRQKNKEKIFRNTKARRLEVVLDYLCWVTQEFYYADSTASDKDNLRLLSYATGMLNRQFGKHSTRRKKEPKLRSLPTDEAIQLNEDVSNDKIFTNNITGERNKLIFQLFMGSGIRAGELLSLKVSDVGQIKHDELGLIAYVSVVRRPNDCGDKRIPQPSVKAGEGLVSISMKLIKEINKYVRGIRRDAVNLVGGRETEYLFVNHRRDEYVGQPMNARNLNKIFEKINKIINLSITVSPHVMRYTHFDQFSKKGRDKKVHHIELSQMIRDRGRWSNKSKMPEKYTERDRFESVGKLIDERDNDFE